MRILSARVIYTLLFEQYRGLVDSLRDDPAFLPELAQTSRSIAQVLDDSSPPEVWRAAWLGALSLYQELVRRQPANAEYQMMLGDCHFWLGHNLRPTGRPVEGDDHLRRAGQIWRELCQVLRERLAINPSDRTLKKQLRWCEMSLGGLEPLLGRRTEAIAVLRHAREVARAVCQEEPAEWESRRQLGLISWELARVLREDRPAEALDLARSAVDLFDASFRSDPLNADILHELARVIDGLAVLEDHLDRPEDALRDFRRAAELYRHVLRDRPFNVVGRSRLGRVCHQIGRILVETGRPAEALEPYREAVELREALYSLTPENALESSACAGTWYRLGEALENLGRFADAVDAYRKCLDYQREVCRRVPEVAAHRTSLDERLRHTAWLLLRFGRWDQAAEIVRERKALRPGDPTVALGVAVLQAADILVGQSDGLQLAHFAWEVQRDIVDALAASGDGRHLPAREARTAGVRPAAVVSAASNQLIP
jgi:tetratricopeptide (TPR) repeat protein